MNDRARRRHRLRMPVQPEARQLRHSKLLAQNPLRVIVLENPVVHARFHSARALQQGSLGRLKQLLRPRQQSFPRPQKLQFIAQRLHRARPAKLRGLKFSGRQIHIRHSQCRPRRILRHRRQKIILPRLQHCPFSSRPRRNHPHNFAPHNFLARPRQFHLVANRDLESRPNQPCDIPVRCVVRHPAHGNRLALFPVPGCQCDLQFARCDDRVFVEQFVEIAQPEKQQRVRIPRLDPLVLLHERCSRLAHVRFEISNPPLTPGFPIASAQTRNPAPSPANNRNAPKPRHAPRPCSP